MDLPDFGPVPLPLLVLTDQVFPPEDDMLPSPVFDHAQGLEGGDDIARVDAPLLGEGLDTELLATAAKMPNPASSDSRYEF